MTRLFDPVTGSYVWGTPRTTMRTQYADDLDLPVDGDRIGRDRLVPRGYVGSRGPINTGWQLLAGLRKFGGYTPGVDAHPFFYDWRLPALESARLLAAQIGDRRVDIVTHSAGALVALAYVELLGGNVENLILIAPPRHGVIDAFRVLVRPERFLRRSFEADTVATWPFVLELLPEDGRFLVGRDLDLWCAEDWRTLRRHDPRLDAAFARSLADAKKFRDELARAPLPAGTKLHVIAGDCVATARKALARSDGTFAFYPSELRENEQDLAGDMFVPGDGTVPSDGDGLLLCDGHQGIAADPHVHRALVRILRGR